MSLRTYSKAPLTFAGYSNQSNYPEHVEALPPKQLYIPDQTRVTMWSLIDGIYNSLKILVATSSSAGLVIPVLFMLCGGALIYMQLQPSIAHQLKESAGYYNQGTTSLVQENYIVDKLQYLSNPGSNYFQQLQEQAFSTQGFAIDNESLNYEGTMYLTIPSIGFDRLPIRGNVESGVRDIYNRVLNTSLAHFKGTPIPGISHGGNTVIYGHSAGGSYNPSPSDVLAAFTFLTDMQVGDVITLELDGTKYSYRMSRSKVVEPNDTSIITGVPGKEMLTLFTCYPPGVNTRRYVIQAVPI